MLYKGKSLSCTKRSIGIHNVFVVFVTTKSGDFAERHGSIEHFEELGAGFAERHGSIEHFEELDFEVLGYYYINYLVKNLLL